MPQVSNRLTAIGARSLPAGKHLDGAGLYLLKSSCERGRWMLRYRQHGRRRDMGLGSWPAVSLAEARRTAETVRAQIRSGLDPITTRKEQRRAHQNLLRDVARECFEAKKSELRADGVAGRWFTPLELHVLPRLGSTPVTQIGQIAIRDALAQVWKDKPVTAEKALQRLGIVLKHAAAMGLDVDLQAVMKAKLLLGKPRQEVRHIPAMHWSDVPAFYASLADPSPTHLTLRLLILTGVRSAPARNLRAEQIDWDKAAWTIPAEMMKGRVDQTEDFRVPISMQASEVIRKAERGARGGYLFPGARSKVISDMTLSMFMRRANLKARPHGFRTSLRVWLAEETDAPAAVAETILGHTSGSKVERAYRRTDFLDQRRELMQKWANFVSNRD